MGHMAMLHLTEESLKSLFEIHLNQITIASAFVLSGERSNLQWNCPLTSRRNIIVPRDTPDSFVKSTLLVY